jgi:hypothetical protein
MESEREQYIEQYICIKRERVIYIYIYRERERERVVCTRLQYCGEYVCG